jgi:hypothetical protein
MGNPEFGSKQVPKKPTGQTICITGSKRSWLLTGLLFAGLGTMPLLNNLGKPRVAALHVPEVLGLVASGLLFGMGFVFALIGFGRFDSSRKDQSRPPGNE